MAQLVQVQHMRGALGGNRFYALLSPGGVEQQSLPKGITIEAHSILRLSHQC